MVDAVPSVIVAVRLLSIFNVVKEPAESDAVPSVIEVSDNDPFVKLAVPSVTIDERVKYRLVKLPARILAAPSVMV